MSDTSTFDLERDGLCVLPGICAAEMADINRCLDIALDTMAAEIDVSLTDYLRLVSTWNLSGETCHDSLSRIQARLLSALQTVARPTASSVAVEFFVKTSSTPRATHAHQDIGYLWQVGRRRYKLTTWVVFDDCDGHSGALSFLPGSHRGAVSPQQDFLSPEFIDRATSDHWLASARTVAVKAGDVVVFDVRTWHAASPLQKGTRRRALALRWATQLDSEPLDIPLPDTPPNVFGMNSAGALLMQAATPLFPVLAAMQDKTSLSRSLDTMLLARDSDEGVLAPDVWTALFALQRALRAQALHDARPSAENIWIPIRDSVIPALNRAVVLAGQGDQP